MTLIFFFDLLSAEYSPFTGIDKGAVLQEARVFNDPQLDPRRCSQVHALCYSVINISHIVASLFFSYFIFNGFNLSDFTIFFASHFLFSWIKFIRFCYAFSLPGYNKTPLST